MERGRHQVQGRTPTHMTCRSVQDGKTSDLVSVFLISTVLLFQFFREAKAQTREL